MESFDLPNPLHWRHMAAMASWVTGNSTDRWAAASGKQERRQIVLYYRPLVKGIQQSLEVPLTKDQ